MSSSSLILGGLSGSGLIGVLHLGSSPPGLWCLTLPELFLIGAEILGLRAFTRRPLPLSSLSGDSAPAASRHE